VVAVRVKIASALLPGLGRRILTGDLEVCCIASVVVSSVVVMGGGYPRWLSAYPGCGPLADPPVFGLVVIRRYCSGRYRVQIN
jgi:hypothetical protein